MVYRSNPIPETLDPVEGFGTLCIYKTPSSRYYQARCYLGRIIKRSLKTDKRSVAIQAAKEFYHDCLVKKQKNEPLTTGSAFKKVADSLLEEDKRQVALGHRKPSLVRDGGYILSHLTAFYKNTHPKDITFQSINDYIKQMSSHGKQPSGATVKNHLIWLGKTLRHANQLGITDRIPVFPRIHRIDNPRPWLDKEQYKLLLRTCHECEGHKPPTEKVHQPITKELRWVCMFLVNSYLRPPDLKNLRNRDIAVVKNGQSRYLRIIAKSKRKPSPVVTERLAVDVYEKLTAFNNALGFGRKDDFVFFPKLGRAYMFQTMRLQFNFVLEKAGLKQSPGETSRTLYSLRHSAVMFALLDTDIDTFTLAKNCRTSEDMIERFYGSHLQAERNIEKFHKKKSHSGVAEIIHKTLEDGREYWALAQMPDASEVP